MFENLADREAYRRGVNDALESVVLHQGASQVRALKQWARDLEDWDGGEPPPGPNEWPAANSD